MIFLGDFLMTIYMAKKEEDPLKIATERKPNKNRTKTKRKPK